MGVKSPYFWKHPDSWLMINYHTTRMIDDAIQQLCYRPTWGQNTANLHLWQLSNLNWMMLEWYCWWLKSCTTWDVWNPINNGINYLSTGAGFQPSTVPSSYVDPLIAFDKIHIRWRVELIKRSVLGRSCSPGGSNCTGCFSIAKNSFFGGSLQTRLVGGWNHPVDKYAQVKIGSFPTVVLKKNSNTLKPPAS